VIVDSRPPSPSRWHHRPSHIFAPGATYIVTAGTLHKEHIFCDDQRLRLLETALFEVTQSFDWQLDAWAIFPNHYHFIARSPGNAGTLRPMIQRLHSQSARLVNEIDHSPGRRVWFQYWDTCLTFEKSYLARLNYVHQNAVKRRLVALAENYPFCSAAWFHTHADPTFRRKVESFRADRLRIEDDF
jgi:putative transposase